MGTSSPAEVAIETALTSFTEAAATFHDLQNYCVKNLHFKGDVKKWEAIACNTSPRWLDVRENIWVLVFGTEMILRFSTEKLSKFSFTLRVVKVGSWLLCKKQDHNLRWSHDGLRMGEGNDQLLAQPPLGQGIL